MEIKDLHVAIVLSPICGPNRYRYRYRYRFRFSSDWLTPGINRYRQVLLDRYI